MSIHQATSAASTLRMRKQRRRDTSCEMALRREMFRRGFRYRVDVVLPFNQRRRADMVFSRSHVAVFVDGCFWHACEQHGTWPQANKEWWRAKLLHNRARDTATDAALNATGWTVVRIWEHEDVGAAAARVVDALQRSREVNSVQRLTRKL